MKRYANYVKGRCSHREYYGQFVTDRYIEAVVRYVGEERILSCKSVDDIPLRVWDESPRFLSIGAKMKRAGDWLSLSSCVCLAKEAAKQFKEKNQNKNI